ncbi:glycosyltransferase family 4 protein [Pseudoalteromonas tunicata]|uniref:glycosyltransferase family 4 protein n=1 Tax=Pseudoalteromonas tunicata TaxID=314281 RepID=UPI00273E3E2F|nr:glycosyltransferase family 4 protein [Pseudoalteromonas tunicata]MDP5211687.1 glycosyltransferase family 4 protein [Pseudoalteromonas tunicata]
MVENSNIQVGKEPECILITSNLYKPNIGGIENSLFHLSEEYVKKGFRVVIAVSDINSDGIQLPLCEEVNGVIILRYKAKEYRGALGFIKHVINAIVLYKKIKREYKPKHSICRYHFNLVLMKLAGINNVTYLIPGVVKNETRISPVETHSKLASYRAKLSFSFHKWLQNLSMTYSDNLVVFSQNMLEQVSELTQRTDIQIGKPGVSLDRFKQLSNAEKKIVRENLNLASEKKVFLCIGRFVQAKGFETAIRAFSKLPFGQAELWLLGEGPLETHFKALITELGCGGTVHILGKKSNPEMYYMAADFFVMSSIYEPLGQTILEALASGLPLISAHSNENIVTATDEIICDEFNLFVKEHSVLGFYSAFEQAIRMSDKHYLDISNFNRIQAETRFSWGKLSSDLVDGT